MDREARVHCTNTRCRYRFSLSECSRKPERNRDFNPRTGEFVDTYIAYCPRCGRACPHYRLEKRAWSPGWSPG